MNIEILLAQHPLPWFVSGRSMMQTIRDAEGKEVLNVAVLKPEVYQKWLAIIAVLNDYERLRREMRKGEEEAERRGLAGSLR